jgi:hypothetical protein
MRRRLAAVLGLVASAVMLPAAASAQGARPSERCDYTDPSVCLYPWPNDYFTKADRGTPTGRRLNLKRASMPRNDAGRPIDPRDMNRADGFSPGSMLIAKVPGLDTPAATRRSAVPPIGNVGRSLLKRSPVVVINARTGKRHPVWAEVDVNPPRRRDRLLIVRPARNFAEGERYIVALRYLRTRSGRTIRPSRGFRIYRDSLPSRNRLVERRRAHFERIFRKLRKAGVPRGGLYLAWDFTVASRRSLTGRALHMRDRAFRQLGDTNLGDLRVRGRSPAFTVDVVQERSPADDDRIARHIEGTITVPCFLTNGCRPGGRFTFDRQGRPEQHGTTAFRYFCNIPRSALDLAAPPEARAALFGHGLLGDPAADLEAGFTTSMSSEHNVLFCATAWAGFAAEDVPNIITVMGDLSRFNTLADRMQQGFLQQLFLGRALIHPQGFSSHPAFQKDGESVIDTRRLFFDGNSQGGIQGGALTALAPDFERAVLGATGMNYSTLLQRSVDFDEFSPLLYGDYPTQLERQLWLAQVQLLWDRGESNGYAHHMTNRPLPNTPRHRVLLHVAFGDHQVADVTPVILARTIGARIHRLVLAAGRSPLADPWYGLRRIRSYPYRGSALVWWDSGTPGSPHQNVPNRAGQDPHYDPRNDPVARRQKSDFLRIAGRVVDVCGGGPCYANRYTGP